MITGEDLAKVDPSGCSRKTSTTFSAEIKSKRYVKSISLSDETHEPVLFEGDLGPLHELSFVEGDILEFTGANGILRIDISEEQLAQIFKRNQESFKSSEVGSYRNTKKPVGEKSET